MTLTIETGNCEITIQCSHRVALTWGLVHTLTDILVEGDGTRGSACVKDLGIGGVAAPCKYEVIAVHSDPTLPYFRQTCFLTSVLLSFPERPDLD